MQTGATETDAINGIRASVLDAQLVELARGSGVLRLSLGEGLEYLINSEGHHELGFPTIGAYALERCERSVRWVQESRILARRLQELPAIRAEVLSGRMNFSMAQVIAAVAHRDNEAAWLVASRGQTVLAMRNLVKEHVNTSDRAGLIGAIEASDDNGGGLMSAEADEDRVGFTVTVDREDVWLFERARIVAKAAGATTLADVWDALVAEGASSLMGSMERGTAVPFDDEVDRDAARQLARIREEEEARAEARLRLLPQGMRCVLPQPVFDGDAEATDAELRRIAARLARRDLELGEVAEQFWKARGWRLLGYATALQYARDRLGMSLSAVKEKRMLARRARILPALRKSVEAGMVGYEASRLVATIASPTTANAWVGRARMRTVRHLREEVDAAQMLARLQIDTERWPPSEEAMVEIASIEARVLAGQVVGASTEAPECPDIAAAGQISAGHSLGRVALRFSVPAGTRRFYRWLERTFSRFGPRQVSFVRYLCIVFLDAWRIPEPPMQYADVYARDGHRCTSPVCGRRGVTPHHLLFRSAGGDDSSENVASLCWWCHLEGVHGARLTVEPPASAMRWRVGRRPHTTVTGRQRTVHASPA